MANKYGTAAADTLFGTDLDDVIFGYGGADVLLGLDGDDKIYGGADNDSLYGGKGEDTLYGGVGDDLLQGGAGADRLDGGPGRDTASYASSSEWVHVDLSTGMGSSGDTMGDRLYGIENLVGSAHDDVLVGDAGDNRLSGGGGNDLLVGGAGADTLDGGIGNDTVSYRHAETGVVLDMIDGYSHGAAILDRLISIENIVGTDFADVVRADHADNRLFGGAGDDELWGRGGADRIDGGAGVDWARFDDSLAVRVNLETHSGSGGDAEGDEYWSIENVAGSDFGDVLIGDAKANRLLGLGGDDQLDGGAGDDLFRDAQGADRFGGGEGVDTVDYSVIENPAERVTVNLTTGKGGLGAAGDSYSGVENAIGSSGDDNTLGDSSRGAGNADRITDFAEGDRIDFSAIDGDASAAGHQGFEFIGDADFTGHGQIRVFQDGGQTFVQIDVQGSNKADMTITLDGLHDLIPGDFGLI